MAEETARSTQDVMEKLIRQVGGLRIGPESSRSQPASGTTESGKRGRGSIGSGRYSDTSGALQCHDDFSSIGYSFEDQEPSRIVDPPGLRSGLRPVAAAMIRKPDPTSLKLEALRDKP